MQQIHEKQSPGDIICDRYLVIDLIGKGGFSAVYLVEDQQGEDSFFALKEVIATDKEVRKLFTFECNLLKRLDHPSLPRVHQVFENEAHSRLYMLMDYVEGPNLETLRRIQPEKRFSFPMIFAILAPVVDAIAYLHQQNPPIIHRDIKPSNIIVPVVGGKTMLVDFGIAKEYDALDTTSALRHGSRGYGAPEHYATGTNARTDIYGLGAVLYTLLTGQVPTDALERMMPIMNGEPDPLKPVSKLVPTIPLHISMGIERAMSIKITERFATVREFWQAIEAESVQQPRITDALNSLVATPPVPETSAKRDEPSSQPPREKTMPRARSRERILLSVFLVLLIIAGIGVGFWGFPMIGRGHGATPTRLPTITHLPRPTLTTTGSVAPNAYPRLSASYHGTVSDLLANIPYQMTLTNMKQNAGHISGFLKAAQFSGAFTGFLDTSKHIYFTVSTNKGSSSLYFTGAVRANGSLDGSFCQVDQDGQCIPGDVFGLWNAAPGIAASFPTRSAFQAGFAN